MGHASHRHSQVQMGALNGGATSLDWVLWKAPSYVRVLCSHRQQQISTITDRDGHPLPLHVLEATWAVGDIEFFPLTEHEGEWARAVATAAEAAAIAPGALADLSSGSLLLNTNRGQQNRIRAPAPCPTSLACRIHTMYLAQGSLGLSRLLQHRQQTQHGRQSIMPLSSRFSGAPKAFQASVR